MSTDQPEQDDFMPPVSDPLVTPYTPVDGEFAGLNMPENYKQLDPAVNSPRVGDEWLNKSRSVWVPLKKVTRGFNRRRLYRRPRRLEDTNIEHTHLLYKTHYKAVPKRFTEDGVVVVDACKLCGLVGGELHRQPRCSYEPEETDEPQEVVELQEPVAQEPVPQEPAPQVEQVDCLSGSRSLVSDQFYDAVKNFYSKPKSPRKPKTVPDEVINEHDLTIEMIICPKTGKLRFPEPGNIDDLRQARLVFKQVDIYYQRLTF